MSLPKIELPIYQTTLLSQKNPIKYTPFTVKESTILMMAKESGEIQTMVDSLKQIIGNCLIDKTINVDKLPMIDLEWLFLQLHARSSGEKVPLFFKCTNEVEGKECGMILECEVDLTKVEINPKPSNNEKELRIMLDDKIGVQMRYPTFEATRESLRVKDETKEDKMLTAMCIEYVFDENTVTRFEDATTEEWFNFVESIPNKKYELLENFFDHCPKIKHNILQKCVKCGFDHDIKLEGLSDFFE